MLIYNPVNTKIGKKWHCQTCKKDINISTESVQINCNFHKHRERYALIVAKYKFVNPEITQIDNIFTDGIKDCEDKFFHIFEYRFEYYIKFERKTSGEVF